MANCNKLFLDFNKEITPSADHMQRMKTSREALEKKISDIIQEKLAMTVDFYTQGSGARDMKTLIIKANGTYDADRGVYLPEEPGVSAQTVQGYVHEAVKDYTDDGAEHRRKCIRVLFKCAYNIDFPVYYQVSGESYAYIAIKGDGWIKDDPSKMIEWLSNQKDDDGQLIRVIKYIKAWASACNFKMPSGIALTVWAVRNFTMVPDRDDKCLLGVLQNIKNSIKWSVTCMAPVEPYDDLAEKLNESQKEKFRKELEDFCLDAEKAINEPNQLKSSKIWIKYFGDRFKEGIDEEVDKKAELLMAATSLIQTNNAKLDSVGRISPNTGVPHQKHRNYGG